jgi:AraC family transcriptional regulator of arabinose operon
MRELRPITPHAQAAPLVTGRFAQGAGYQAYRPRGTDDWLLIYTLDGRGRFVHAHGEFISRIGDLVLLRAGTPHDYGVDSSAHWELLWTHFHPRADWLTLLAWPELAPGLSYLQLDDPAMRERITARFEEVHRLAISSNRRRSDWAMNALEEVLLLCDEINPRSEQGRIDPRIQLAMNFLCRRLHEKLTLQEVADHCSMSLSRLAHLFREQVGQPPNAYLEHQRLARAAQLLLATQLSVKEIAAQAGFTEPSYFARRFKAVMGRSASEYRERR